MLGFRLGRSGLTLLGCLTSLAVLAATSAAASHRHRVSYSTGPFTINCKTADSTPQVCDPPEKLKVRVGRRKVRIKQLRYVASTEHCSAGRVLVSLDGKPIGRTDFVDAGEQATVDDLKVTLDRGRHKFGFRVEVKTGGCNAGAVGSWGGKITLRGSKKRR
jgi:hypothetical protein